MNPVADELKKRLMAQAEVAIDQMLSRRKPVDEIPLTEIEQLARVAGDRVMHEITDELVKTSEDQQDPTLRCPDCGKHLHYKGKKDKPIIAETGETTIRRAYYCCPQCRKGIIPPG